ncbi:MAG: RDD family protein [Anaerolineae bacterium]
MEKIGFGPRLIAALIDGVIIGIAGGILSAVGNMIDSSGTVGYLLSVLVGLGYYYYFWTTTGQTIGKGVMKIKVVATDGTKVTPMKAVLRYVGYYVSAIFLLGYIWILFDKDKQGWHDKIAGTYVVKA